MAKMQVSALEARQLSREKEIEALRRQTLEYQVRGRAPATSKDQNTPGMRFRVILHKYVVH